MTFWNHVSEGSHKVFTDKFQLYTLCLPNLKHATKNDASFRRDMWGRYFRVKTWEELKAMADEITASNNDDGIALTLERYFAI